MGAQGKGLAEAHAPHGPAHRRSAMLQMLSSPGTKSSGRGQPRMTLD